MGFVLPDGFTRDELLACVDREIRMRERVYPAWVRDARISRETADREIARMRAVRFVVQQLAEEPPTQPSLFGGTR